MSSDYISTKELSKMDLYEIFNKKKTVYEDNGCFILLMPPNNYEYWFEVDRCKSYKDLIGWISHLSCKNWVTSEMINDLISVVCDYNDLKIELK